MEQPNRQNQSAGFNQPVQGQQPSGQTPGQAGYGQQAPGQPLQGQPYSQGPQGAQGTAQGATAAPYQGAPYQQSAYQGASYQGAQGAPGLQGAQGAPGLQGAQGPQGVQGPQNAQGPQGQSGSYPYVAPSAPYQNAAGPNAAGQGAAGQGGTYPNGAYQGAPGWGRPAQSGPQGYGQPGYGRPGQGMPGYGAPGYGRPGQPQMAVRKKSVAPVVIAIVAVTLVVVIVLLVAMARLDSSQEPGSPSSSPAASGAASPSASASASASGVRYDSCDSYTKFLARLEELNGESDTLKGLTLDTANQYIADFIPSSFASSESNTNASTSDQATLSEYVNKWADYIATTYAGVKKGDERVSQDCQAANAHYDDLLARLNVLVEYFQMDKRIIVTLEAVTYDKETLGASLETTDDQGHYYYNLSFFDTDDDVSTINPYDPIDGVSYNPDYQYPDAATLTAQEAQIAAYAPSGPGADGTYLQAGVDMLGLAGVTLVHSGADDDPCQGSLDDNTIAAYCQVGENAITINDKRSDYTTTISNPDYLFATLRHEFAHYDTNARCGTTRPPLGVSHEALANSYAKLFLGANVDALTRGQEDYAEYTMTQETDDAATKLHNGVCIANPL